LIRNLVKNRRNYSFVTGSYRTIKWSDTVMLNSNRDRHVVGVCSQGATEVLRSVYVSLLQFWSLSMSYNLLRIRRPLVMK